MRKSLTAIGKISLSLLLLTGCKEVLIPDDIAEFLYGCNIDKTIEKTTDIHAENKNTVYDSEGKELGNDAYTLTVHRPKERESYSYLKRETYSGNRISYDSESKLYVVENQTEIHFDSQEEIYKATLTQKGTLEGSNEVVTSEKAVYKYKPSQFKEIDLSVFYTKESGNTHSGGLYYADFFLSIIGEFEYFEVKEDLFYYSFENLEYKQGDEIAIVSETLTMNSDGLLVSLLQEATNKNTGVKNVSSMNVTYNL